MHIIINQQDFDLPQGATLDDALAAFGARPPFAVAVNLGFVHRQDYPTTLLQAGDRVEVVQPVAGG
ncbi:sulfur carrier protein ThiS [Methyloparacoccus murrellii]|jgi:sulfur carrier protein